MFGRKIPDKVMGSGSAKTNETRTSSERNPGGRDTARRGNSSGVGTVLGEDTVFKGGKIISEGTLRIDGCVEGEIEAHDSVMVGPTGVVKANIKARTVAVSGKVFGNIQASERLELQPTSEVHGDVATAAGALIIEGGAKLEGRCIMGTINQSAQAAGRPQETRPAESKQPEQNKSNDKNDSGGKADRKPESAGARK